MVTYEVVDGYLHIEDPELGISYTDTKPLGPTLAMYSEGLCLDHEKKTIAVRKRVVQEALYLPTGADGELRRYHRSGALSMKSFYRSGKIHGPSECFYSDGKIASRSYFIEDKREGRVDFFRQDGSLYGQLRFKNGLFHGTQSFYFKGGSLKCSLPYMEGLFDGQMQLFFQNGGVKREIAMQRGKRQGIDCMWDEQGVVLFAFEYDNGRLIKTQIEDPIARAYKVTSCEKKPSLSQ
ncbi:MAG: hypothetical protein JSR46_02365 [Verrucomicrobia bacterium]|nr:hypothetical protein [Verrucomicrobiota bacterium]